MQEVIEASSIGARDVGAQFASFTVKLVTGHATVLEKHAALFEVGFCEFFRSEKGFVLLERYRLVLRSFVDETPDFEEAVSITFEPQDDGTVFTLRRVVHPFNPAFSEPSDMSADPLALLAAG